MSRPIKSIELRTEETEGDLALLGSALVHLEMVAERLRIAERYASAGLIQPALDDIEASSSLIQRTQVRLARRNLQDNSRNEIH